MAHSAYKKLLLLPLTNLFLRHSSFIHFASNDELAKTSSSYKNLTRRLVCSTPIDIPPASSPRLDRLLVYTVSRFSSIKQLDITASALSRLISNHSSVNIDIVHFGDYSENYKLYKSIVSCYSSCGSSLEVVEGPGILNINRISLNPNVSRVFFPGHIMRSSVDELVSLYSNHIFLQMSKSEGQSNSVLEALARRSLSLVSPGCNMSSAFQERALLEVTPSHLYAFLVDAICMSKFPVTYPLQYLERHHSYRSVKDCFLPLL